MVKKKERKTSNSQVEALLKELNDTCGYDFHNYKRDSITKRVENFLVLENIASVDSLIEKIKSDMALFSRLINRFTTTVTSMFRDTAVFRCLREEIFPALATYPTIRIWSAGTGSGEEAYSLAIILKEKNLYHRSLIYATDINAMVVEQAYKGIYPLDKISEYTGNYIAAGGQESFSKYYTTSRHQAMFDPGLKKNIVFATHNLGQDAVFNEFQLVLCRNVLIYFNKTLTGNILDLFYRSLCPRGYLCLGSAENLKFYHVEKYFEEIDAEAKIYRRYV